MEKWEHGTNTIKLWILPSHTITVQAGGGSVLVWSVFRTFGACTVDSHCIPIHGTHGRPFTFISVLHTSQWRWCLPARQLFISHALDAYWMATGAFCQLWSDEVATLNPQFKPHQASLGYHWAEGSKPITHHWQTRQELWTAVEGVWLAIPVKHFPKLVESVHRVAAVTRATKGPTYY